MSGTTFKMAAVPSYTPANGVSETMRSIRWILNKHLKNIDFSHSGVEMEKTVDRNPSKPLSVEKIMKIREEIAKGKGNGLIGREQGVSEMAVCNIRNKQRRYKDLPDDEASIYEWFERKSKLKPGVKQH